MHVEDSVNDESVFHPDEDSYAEDFNVSDGVEETTGEDCSAQSEAIYEEDFSADAAESAEHETEYVTVFEDGQEDTFSENAEQAHKPGIANMPEDNYEDDFVHEEDEELESLMSGAAVQESNQVQQEVNAEDPTVDLFRIQENRLPHRVQQQPPTSKRVRASSAPPIKTKLRDSMYPENRATASSEKELSPVPNSIAQTSLNNYESSDSADKAPFGSLIGPTPGSQGSETTRDLSLHIVGQKQPSDQLDSVTPQEICDSRVDALRAKVDSLEARLAEYEASASPSRSAKSIRRRRKRRRCAPRQYDAKFQGDTIGDAITHMPMRTTRRKQNTEVDQARKSPCRPAWGSARAPLRPSASVHGNWKPAVGSAMRHARAMAKTATASALGGEFTGSLAGTTLQRPRRRGYSKTFTYDPETGHRISKHAYERKLVAKERQPNRAKPDEAVPCEIRNEGSMIEAPERMKSRPSAVGYPTSRIAQAAMTYLYRCRTWKPLERRTRYARELFLGNFKGAAEFEPRPASSAETCATDVLSTVETQHWRAHRKLCEWDVLVTVEARPNRGKQLSTRHNPSRYKQEAQVAANAAIEALQKFRVRAATLIEVAGEAVDSKTAASRVGALEVQLAVCTADGKPARLKMLHSKLTTRTWPSAAVIKKATHRAMRDFGAHELLDGEDGNANGVDNAVNNTDSVLVEWDWEFDQRPPWHTQPRTGGMTPSKAEEIPPLQSPELVSSTSVQNAHDTSEAASLSRSRTMELQDTGNANEVPYTAYSHQGPDNNAVPPLSKRSGFDQHKNLTAHASAKNTEKPSVHEQKGLSSQQNITLTSREVASEKTMLTDEILQEPRTSNHEAAAANTQPQASAKVADVRKIGSTGGEESQVRGNESAHSDRSCNGKVCNAEIADSPTARRDSAGLEANLTVASKEHSLNVSVGNEATGHEHKLDAQDESKLAEEGENWQLKYKREIEQLSNELKAAHLQQHEDGAEIIEWFQRHDYNFLLPHVSALVEHGWDNLEAMAQLTEEDARVLPGVKAGHARVLSRIATRMREASREMETLFSGGLSGNFGNEFTLEQASNGTQLGDDTAHEPEPDIESRDGHADPQESNSSYLSRSDVEQRQPQHPKIAMADTAQDSFITEAHAEREETSLLNDQEENRPEDASCHNASAQDETQKKTDEDSIEAYRQALNSQDALEEVLQAHADSDERLSVKSLKKLLKKVGIKSPGSTALHLLLAHIDFDGDGSWPIEEVMAFVRSDASGSDGLGALWCGLQEVVACTTGKYTLTNLDLQLFKKYDKKQSGGIRFSKFTRAMQKLVSRSSSTCIKDDFDWEIVRDFWSKLNESDAIDYVTFTSWLNPVSLSKLRRTAARWAVRATRDSEKHRDGIDFFTTLVRRHGNTIRDRNALTQSELGVAIREAGIEISDAEARALRIHYGDSAVEDCFNTNAWSKLLCDGPSSLASGRRKDKEKFDHAYAEALEARGFENSGVSKWASKHVANELGIKKGTDTKSLASLADLPPML